VPRVTRRPAIIACAFALAACGGRKGETTGPTQNTTAGPPIQVVVFTHIEDATPGGVLGTAANRTNYLAIRASLLEMAALARRYSMRWSLEPDWKILLAALQYEDAPTRATTGGLNFLRYLRDSLGVAIDPHSHEGGGYNYTDVAHLLDSLGVGGSTVIGGHIWDPSLPQFSAWDRFRVPVRGNQYPSAMWRGDLLMGSGTPNHVNDPIVSGIWRPKSRDDYFTDDPAGNISCVGAWKGDLAGISELVALYRDRRAPVTCMLTSTMHISPSTITSPNGLTTIENTIIKPLVALRDSSQVKLTDFIALAATWRSEFSGRVCTYRLGTIIH
jgi:hypothetical protein